MLVKKIRFDRKEEGQRNICVSVLAIVVRQSQLYESPRAAAGPTFAIRGTYWISRTLTVQRSCSVRFFTEPNRTSISCSTKELALTVQGSCSVSVSSINEPNITEPGLNMFVSVMFGSGSHLWSDVSLPASQTHWNLRISSRQISERILFYLPDRSMDLPKVDARNDFMIELGYLLLAILQSAVFLGWGL